MEWTEVLIPVCTVITTVIALRKSFNDKFEKIDERFDKLEEKFNTRFDKIDDELKEIRGDIGDVRERMSFLEAAHVYTLPVDTIKISPRTEAMKEKMREAWKRRKIKKLEKKES